MKKIISLLLLLLMPVIVKAEDLDLSKYEYKEYDPQIISTRFNRFLREGNLTVSTSHIYEDGLYKLTGDYQYIDPEIYYSRLTDKPDYLFACEGNKIECSSIVVIYPEIDTYIFGVMANYWVSGEPFTEDMINIYFADEYEVMDNGHYRLIDPVSQERWDFHDRKNKYVCKDLYKHEDCEKIGIIKNTIENNRFYVDWFEDRITVGESIVHKNGKYYLQNARVINPEYDRVGDLENKVIFTCFTKEDNCEEPVRIVHNQLAELYFDAGFVSYSYIYYEVLGVTEESLTIKLDETGTIKDVDDNDIVTIADPDLIEITIKDGDGIVTPKKDGSTDITIVTSTHQTRLIHLTINPLEKEEAPKEQKNPNTSNIIYIPIIIFILSAIVYFIGKTEQNSMKI